ncbi:FixG Ig-like domain-containing protein [Rhodoblastus sphagnicola]|uniref:FixG Ig-like domain-containing protein n=2 Tax=Rhodoblastus sphagnicola TaxID=333368 RepID=UPI0030842041
MKPIFKLIRPRTVIYSALILLTAAVMVTVYANRATIGLNVLHDRNPLHVVMSDGSVRNAYTIRILNKSDRPRRLDLALAEGLKATLSANGESLRDSAALSFDVDADQTFEARVFLTAPQADVSGRSTPVVFRLIAKDPTDVEVTETRDFFDAP